MGGCSSSSKGSWKERETQGTLGHHCKLINGSKKALRTGRACSRVEMRERPQVVGGGWAEAWIQTQTKGGSLGTTLCGSEYTPYRDQGGAAAARKEEAGLSDPQAPWMIKP